MTEDISFSCEPTASFAIPARPAWIRLLIPDRRPGVYLFLDGEVPIYVGRSDHCLRTLLISHELLSSCSHLAMELQIPKDAFTLESFWFHKLKGTPRFLNQVHPACPWHMKMECPFCPIGEISPVAVLSPKKAGSTA